MLALDFSDDNDYSADDTDDFTPNDDTDDLV